MSDPTKPASGTPQATTTKLANTAKTTTDGIVADGEDHNPVKEPVKSDAEKK